MSGPEERYPLHQSTSHYYVPNLIVCRHAVQKMLSRNTGKCTGMIFVLSIKKHVHTVWLSASETTRLKVYLPAQTRP